MFHPPTHTRARTEYNISTGRLLHYLALGTQNLPDSTMPKQASINAFYYVLLFNVSK